MYFVKNGLTIGINLQQISAKDNLHANMCIKETREWRIQTFGWDSRDIDSVNISNAIEFSKSRRSTSCESEDMVLKITISWWSEMPCWSKGLSKGEHWRPK